MRWAPIVSVFAVLAVTSIFQSVLAAPVDVVLENRARGLKITAKSLKTSNYRQTATKGSNYSKTKTGVTKVKTPKTPPKGKHADHILEAQTVAKALNKGGRKTKGIGAKAHREVKKALNDKSNLSFVNPGINGKKGQGHRTALAGKTPKPDRHVKDYMQKTAPAGRATAKKIDGILKKNGVKGVSVQREHNGVLKKMGVKRDLSLEELD